MDRNRGGGDTPGALPRFSGRIRLSRRAAGFPGSSPSTFAPGPGSSRLFRDRRFHGRILSSGVAGGWNLIGRTGTILWDPWRDPPNLISAGDEIRLVHSPFVPGNERGEPERRATQGKEVAEVLHPGQKTLIVGPADFGRDRFGLAPGGIYDPEAAACANRAVGNRAGDMILECVLVGPRLRFLQHTVCSWYGADATIRIDGSTVNDNRQFHAMRGDVVEIGRLSHGARGWLAIQGGIEDPGPPHAVSPTALAPGQRLMAGDARSEFARIASLDRSDAGRIEAIPGPHPVPSEQLSWIASTGWIVTPAFDRLGVRLRPETPTPFEPPATMESCGMQFGTAQWHPGGELVLLGPDHPITGGYLQPMTIPSRERWKIAQLAPGERIRLAFTRT